MLWHAWPEITANIVFLILGMQDEEEVPPESEKNGKDEDVKDTAQKDEGVKDEAQKDEEKQDEAEKSAGEGKSEEGTEEAGSKNDAKVRLVTRNHSSKHFDVKSGERF